MFNSRYWARAFIRSLDARGADLEEGVGALRVLASWAGALPGMVSGGSAAEKLEKQARESLAKTGTLTPATEIAARFLALMAKKGRIGQAVSAAFEAKKLLDERNGLVAVCLEYAQPPEDAFVSRLKEAIKRKTGAAAVELEGKADPGLIGGYRLRMGDKIIDASVRFQLRELEARLANGVSGANGGLAGGGN